MSVWDVLNGWLSAAIVASLSLVSSVIEPSVPAEHASSADVNPTSFMIGWAQQVEQPPIEQVGEGPGDDLETLDEGAPQVESAAGVDDETLDAGAQPVAQGDDVETLDEGAPATTAAQPSESVAAAPAVETTTTYVAPEQSPAVATGPVLPVGFGTGRVQAVAGRGEIPIGIADCQVGAVTGRAYVGLNCGEHEGSSFVGHAPSFEAFPFVLEAEFPFEGDEAFFTDPNFPFGDDEELAVAASRDDESETNVVVSARGGNRDRDDDAGSEPTIETGGESSVAFAQRARDRDRGVENEDTSPREKGAKKRKRSEAGSGVANAESRQRARGNDGGQGGDVNVESQKKKSKQDGSKDKTSKKDRADQKDTKKRDRNRS